MQSLRIIVPVLVTAFVTAGSLFSAIWLTGLVPGGEWSEFIKGTIVVFILGCTLVVIGWSAYFIYILRKSLESD